MSIIERVSDLEREYVSEVLESSFRGSKGANMMSRLESAFAEKFGVEYAISFVNGTSTMHAALEALQVGEGDEVIVPPLTMSATTFAVLQANATPVFADVNPDTFQIDAGSIVQRITEKTKAIITVSLYGLSPDMDAIKSIADVHGLKIIEDNAQCFMGKYDGKLVGSFGDCASYSFQSSKHLTSGEGGMVITNDGALAERIRKVQSLGYAGVSAKKGKISKSEIQNPDYKRHVSMGWNYRMPELCCAVALAQVERIEELVKIRKASAGLFSEATHDFREWFVPQFVPDNCEHSYWAWVAKLNRTDITWKDIYAEILSSGGDGPYGAWQLTYLEPVFEDFDFLGRQKYISGENMSKYRRGLCPNAESLQPKLFQFKTNYWNMAEAAQQAEILRSALSKFE